MWDFWNRHKIAAAKIIQAGWRARAARGKFAERRRALAVVNKIKLGYRARAAVRQKRQAARQDRFRRASPTQCSGGVARPANARAAAARRATPATAATNAASSYYQPAGSRPAGRRSGGSPQHSRQPKLPTPPKEDFLQRLARIEARKAAMRTPAGRRAFKRRDRLRMARRTCRKLDRLIEEAKKVKGAPPFCFLCGSVNPE